MARVAALAALCASACFSKPPFTGGGNQGDGGTPDGTTVDGRWVDARDLQDASRDADAGDADADADADDAMTPECPAVADTFDGTTAVPCTWGIVTATGSVVQTGGRLELSGVAQAGGTPAGCTRTTPIPFDRGLWLQMMPVNATTDVTIFEITAGTSTASVRLLAPTGGLKKLITQPGVTNAVPSDIDPAWQWWKFQRNGTTNTLDVLRSTDGMTWVTDTANVDFMGQSLDTVTFGFRLEVNGGSFHLGARVDNLNAPCSP